VTISEFGCSAVLVGDLTVLVGVLTSGRSDIDPFAMKILLRITVNIAALTIFQRITSIMKLVVFYVIFTQSSLCNFPLLLFSSFSSSS